MQIREWTECWQDQVKERKSIDQNKICTFGIQCLDDALIGILKNDLIVIGADSGVGKSDICLNMALHNAKAGRKVAVYFLEGGAREAISRIKWKAIRDVYFARGYKDQDLDYRKWRMGMLENPVMDEIEKIAFVELYKLIGERLFIYDFEAGFTIQNLMNSIGYFINGRPNKEHQINESFYDIDLIIIDHLQYFTLTNERNEIGEMTQILKAVKEIADNKLIPIVMVSHLRKKDKDRGLPGQDDFYGTGNIAKISSVAITIANHPTRDDYDKQLYPTFFRIVKSRTGARPTYGMLSKYDFKKGEYEKDYNLFTLVLDRPVNQPLVSFKAPHWARENLRIQEEKARKNTDPSEPVVEPPKQEGFQWEQ